VLDVSLPFRGSYLPHEIDSGGGIVHSYNSALLIDACSVANFSDPNTKGEISRAISTLPVAAGTVDSGASAHCTFDCKLLVNTKPCDEVFGAANGVLAQATLIGSLPLIARADDGQFIHLVITNVRCVPEFSNFTLLSVDQLWEEQRIKSTFCDEKHLLLPKCSGGHTIPYDKVAGRNTLKFASAVQLYDKGILAKPKSSQQHTAHTALGFRDIKSIAHIARLSGAQVGELMHRRWHRPVKVIRNAANTTSDAPPNLARADNFSCEFCASCNATKASHGASKTVTEPSSLAPCNQPGTLHIDLKGMMKRSVHGYHYAMFAIDEYSRFVFVEYLKSKESREQIAAVSRIIGRFNTLVNSGCDDDGKPLPKPAVTVIRSDHEGALESKLFDSFRADMAIDSIMSPPDDHDLNPIAERTIGVISNLACCIRGHSAAPVSLWPHLLEHAVNIHNSTSSSCGTSTADTMITAHQRLSRVQPSIMDLGTFGCMAVALKPPPHRTKSELSSRGWVGKYLGRSLGGKTGQWDVLTEGNLVHNSSVQIDEEHLPWRGQAKQPLRPTSRARGADEPQHASRGGQNPSIASTSDRDSLCMLNLFSGPYSRAEGLSQRLKQQFGWKTVINIYNDPDSSGGWTHDLLNDETYAKILALASRGAFDAIMIAWPCSTFSASRFFLTIPPGPPPVRTKTYPDGLPEAEIDPKHLRELRNTNTLIERSVHIAVAARNSAKKTTIIGENPADRSIRGMPQFGEDTKEHGSLFATSTFKQLQDTIPDSSMATFAYCRLGSEFQKYTTIWYTNEAAPILDQLNTSVYKCNHASHPKMAGGRLENGSWASAAASAYPAQLNIRLAMALSFARTGDPRPINEQAVEAWAPQTAAPEANGQDPPALVPMDEPIDDLSALDAAASPPASTGSTEAPPRFLGGESPPRNFPNLDSAATTEASPLLGRYEPPRQGREQRSSQGSTRAANTSYESQLADAQAKRDRREASKLERERLEAAERLETVEEDDDSPYDTYSPFTAAMATVSGSSAALAAFQESDSGHSLSPAGPWVNVGDSITLPGTSGVLDTEEMSSVFNPHQLLSILSHSNGDLPAAVHTALLASVHAALRADSADAPSTHSEAVALDAAAGNTLWGDGEEVELDNHGRNGSWELIRRRDVPKGRRIHKMVWVYKVRRNGEIKVRLCVQGCTLQSGIDFDQTFSSTLRHCSARVLFGHAARMQCGVRSVDFVSAYLQGSFLEGEMVYCHMPAGYVQTDESGIPLVCCVKKPVYGIPQAGRRLQRGIFDWMLDKSKANLRQLDDSDNTIFVYDDPNGLETFTVGVYVDNLQIVHSSKIDDSGEPADPDSYLAKFLTLLRNDWDVVDEGPMVDLLGMECENLPDKSIKIHQEKYVKKLLGRYLPQGPPTRTKADCLPYSDQIHALIESALLAKEKHGVQYPELVTPFQQRCGSYLYLVTATRPDIAYPVCHLCRAMACPTPELLAEFDRLAAYLYFNADLGLVFDSKPHPLECFADASWETRFSTSGWLVMWQGAAISWGSPKQDCVALSSCEAEIVALSECAKDAVYYRKKLMGINPNYVSEPTSVSTDNKGAHDLSYNPEFHKRTKHIQRRHFYVRDVVEAHELVVPLIRTDDNPADFFTKPVSSDKFFKFRAIIMNIKGELPNAVKTALSTVTHRRPSRCDLVRAELAHLSAAATRCLDRRLAGLPLLKADEVPASHFVSRGPALRAELKKLSCSTC
jgi:hypothetical protein